MAFGNGVVEDMPLGSGNVLSGHLQNIDVFTSFVDGIIVGRFNTIDTATGELKPIADGLKAHGVTHRLLAGDMTVIDFTNDNATYVESCDVGYVTVDLVAGDAPVKGGQVYANITVGDDLGKATTTTTTSIPSGVFWEETSPSVWLIKMNIGGQ